MSGHDEDLPGVDGLDEEVDAVVVGGGMAGLVAAHRLTRAGLRPVLVEARGYTGGLVAASRLAGVDYDIGAEGWAVRRPEVADLARSLGLDVEQPAARPSWIYHDDACFPIPAESLLGIPADLTAPDLVAALGAEGARAAADLDRAPLGGALPESLGALVETRMGRVVLDRLVTPVAGGIHAADPHLLSAEVVSPGLLAQVRRCGSLAAAVAQVRRGLPDAPPVASVVGGMAVMPATLAARLEEAGGRVLTRTGVRHLVRAQGQWQVEVARTHRNPDPSQPPVADGSAATLLTPRVVVACSAGPARALLSPTIDTTGPDLVPGAPIAHVNLAVRDPRLGSAPRGNGMLVAPGTRSVQAKALTHLSAKWPSLGAACPPDLHLLRVSYGRSGEREVDLGAELALADASHLLGMELDPQDVVDSQVIHWNGSLAPTTPATRAWVEGLHRQVAELPGLALTGAWTSGSGIAALVPHAVAAAESLV